MTLEEIIRRLIARYGSADIHSVSMSCQLEELGIDGLAVAQIVNYLEAHFGVAIDSRDAVRWATGIEIVATVQHLRAERHREAS
jgi:acyl carrier protein